MRPRTALATSGALATLTVAVGLGLIGCHGSNGADPADVNAAQEETACPTGQVLMSDGTCAAASQVGAVPQNAPATPTNQPAAQQTHQRTASAPSYASGSVAPPPQDAQSSAVPQENDSAPATDSGPYDGQNAYDDQSYQQDAYNDGYQQGYEQDVQSSQPPPPLPVYAQPECPGDGYLWNPGYWNYANAGYYWVPGVWAHAPYTGALWTPGWWGFLSGLYRWHHGYWGSHIGFYGGIPYGYGYNGSGFHGGYWNRDRFMYNRSVTNIRIVNIRNTYNRTVINNVTVNNRVSYNGGRGGLNVRPSRSEFAAMREQHVRPLPAQVEHRTQAMQNRQQYASFNRGRPANVVAARPLQMQRINVAPRVVNPGVRGETRPALAVPRQPQNGAGSPQRPGMAVRPTQPAIQTAHTPPNTHLDTHLDTHNDRPRQGVGEGAGARPTVQPNRPQPNQTTPNQATPTHTQPQRMEPNRQPANVHTQPARRSAASGNPVVARPQSPAVQTQHPSVRQNEPIRQNEPRTAPQTQHSQPRPVQQPRPAIQSRPQVQQPRPQMQQSQPHVQQPRPEMQRSQPQHQEAPHMQEQRQQPAPHVEAPHQAPHAEASHGDHSPHP